MKYKNQEMEMMLEMLKPLLPHRDKIGYVAARNVRKLTDALTEYLQFKNELIKKYGTVDLDADGNELQTISIKQSADTFPEFTKEFDAIREIEHDVELMKLKYDEIIGLLNGEEILKLEFILEE